VWFSSTGNATPGLAPFLKSSSFQSPNPDILTMSPNKPTIPARTGLVSPSNTHEGKKRRRDTLEESDVASPPAKRQRTDNSCGSGTSTCAEEVPYEELPKGASFMTINPETRKPLVGKKDHFTGIPRKRRMMDDLYDRYQVEEPEKLKVIAARRRGARNQKKMAGTQKQEKSTPSLTSPLPSPPPSSPPTSSHSLSGASATHDKTPGPAKSSLTPPSPDSTPHQATQIYELRKSTSWSRRIAAGTNILVRESRNAKPVPYTKDRVTGAIRKRQMMDDFLDKYEEEKPAKFVEYMDHADGKVKKPADESDRTEQGVSSAQ